MLATVALVVGLASGVADATTSAAAVSSSPAAVHTGPLTWRKPVSIDPTRGGFDSVSCASASFCLAGDGSGTVYRRAHGHWSVQAHLAGGGIGQLSCVSRTFCTATIGHPLESYRVLAYNGHRWRSFKGVSDSDAIGLSCVTTSFCLLVNSDGQYQVWNGHRWSKAHFSAGGNYSADGLSCTRHLCAEIDEQGTAEIWHGTKRGASHDIDGLRHFVAVSCTARDCWAVDRTGRTFRYAHARWQHAGRVGSKAGFGNGSLSCWAVGHCVATDAIGHAYTLTKHGWRAAHAVLAPVVSRVDCVSAHFCLAVGRTGQSAVRKAGGWQAAHGVDPQLGSLTSISCAGVHFCVAADSHTGVARFNGTSWTRPARLTYGKESITGLSCPSRTFCTAVTNKNTAWRYADGRWTGELPVHLAGLDGVSCSGAGQCMATGLAQKSVSYWDGTSWTRLAKLPFDGNFADEASCVAAGCYVLAEDGDVWLYAGGTWSLSKHLEDDSAGDSLSCVGGYCLTSFGNGDVFQYADGTWSGPQVSVYEGLGLLSCGSPRLCAGFDFEAHVDVRDGARWAISHRLPGTSQLTDVACVARAECIVVDTHGNADIGRDTAPAPTKLAVSTTTLPAATVGSHYSAKLAATGGVGPYTWTLVAGGVPTGLSLKPNGTVTGTPTAAAQGTWSLTPQVTDADRYVAKRKVTIKVRPSTPAVTTASLPDGYVGSAYSTTLQAAGGTAPYSWAITAGGLPDGLSLSTSGVVSGTPTRTGKWSVTPTVTDASGLSASQKLTLRITNPIDTSEQMTCPGAVFDTTTTCTLTATNLAGGPAPTGTMQYSFGRALEGACTLPSTPGAGASSAACTVQITWPFTGTGTADVTYFGDAAHSGDEDGATITVAAQTGGIDTTGTVSCPDAKANEKNYTCTITVTNSPTTKTPAPTGTASFSYTADRGLEAGQTCTLTTVSTHASHCSFAYSFDDYPVPAQVEFAYDGDAKHHATSETVPLTT